MVLLMYCYLPVDINTTKEGYTVPNIKDDAKALVDLLNSPESQTEGDSTNNNNNNNNNTNRDLLIKFHKDHKVEWIDALAYSYGMDCDEPGFQDLSFTTYMGKYTAAFTYFTMTRERLPHAVFRVVSMPKDGKLTVVELELTNVTRATLKVPTRAALIAAVCAKFNIDAEKVKVVSEASSGCDGALIEIENDADVGHLSQLDRIVVDV